MYPRRLYDFREGITIVTGKIYSFKVFGKLVAFCVSKDLDGYDIGLVSIKRIHVADKSALRIVLWRLAMWVQYK